MSKREPLLTEEQKFGDAAPLLESCLRDQRIAEYFEGLYEAARAKDAELIQGLTTSVARYIREMGELWGNEQQLLAAAEAHGFKPSDQ